MAGPGGGSGGGGFGGGSHGGGFGGGSHGGGFGGGSHGGGFGGGSHGGGFGGPHGGGFGGPHGGPHPGGPHRPPHHHGPHWHGGFFGPGWHFGYGPRYGGGSGCLTGAIIVSIFVAIIALFMILPSGGEYTYVIGSDGIENVLYDEGTMQDYANSKYKKYFGDSENDILLVFLPNQEADGYYTIAWVGDNVPYEINEMFGENTEYGEALNSYINENYFAYSLDTDLASVVKKMSESISNSDVDLSSMNVTTQEKAKSKFYNFTSFDLTESVVDEALQSFTDATGIPMAIVVDFEEKVFGSTTDENVTEIVGSTNGKNQTKEHSTTWKIGMFVLVVSSVLAIIYTALYFAMKSINKKKKNKNDEDLPWES